MVHDDLDPQSILQAFGLIDAVITPVYGGGLDTAIWQVEKSGEVYALRVFQHEQYDACERERVIMQAALAAGLPVPQIHASGSWCNHPVLLLSWLTGRPVADEIRARPWRVWHLGVAFGHMQALIHAVPAPDLLCQQPDAWITWAGPEEKLLQERLRATNDQSNTLLHLDYHPFNVLADGKSITGVIDWRNALAGDPRADAARTVAILRVDVVGRRRLLETILRQAFEKGWRAGYEQKRGIQGDLSLFYAWAGASMENDLKSKRKPEELARIHRWMMKWKKRTRCP